MLGPLIGRSVDFVDMRMACGSPQNVTKIDTSRGKFFRLFTSAKFARFLHDYSERNFSYQSEGNT